MILFLILLALVAMVLALRWQTARLTAKANQLVPQPGTITALTHGSIHWCEWGTEHKGTRSTILLVHGIGAQLQNFHDNLIAPLAQTYHVISLDRPGSGYSERPVNQNAYFDVQAAQIAEFIETENLGPVVFAGHSLAGGIGLRLTMDRPDVVASLALLAPVSQPMLLPPGVFRLLMMPTRFLRRIISRNGGTVLSWLLHDISLRMVFAPELMTPDYMIKSAGWLGLRPRTIECFSEDLMAVPDSLRALHRDYPALAQTAPIGGVLFGLDDRVLIERKHGQPLAQALPSLDYETVPKAGHMFFQHQPDLTANFILRQAAKVNRETPKS